VEELKQIPEKCVKEIEEYEKQLEKLQGDKSKEEHKLKDAMESFKTETKVIINIYLILTFT